MKKEELRLKKGGSKMRIHVVLFVLVLVIALVAGYLAGQASIGSSIFDKENCIPQNDLQFFMDKANQNYEDYAGCVSDAWTLQLACKAQVDAWRNTAISLGYTENATK